MPVMKQRSTIFLTQNWAFWHSTGSSLSFIPLPLAGRAIASCTPRMEIFQGVHLIQSQAAKRGHVRHVLRSWSRCSRLCGIYSASRKCRKVPGYEVNVSLHRGRTHSWVWPIAESATSKNTRTEQFYRRLLWMYLLHVHGASGKSYMFQFLKGMTKKGASSLHLLITRYSERVQRRKA